jgi:lipoprotein-anchoring transpeptidase ErfK/SrfK
MIRKSLLGAGLALAALAFSANSASAQRALSFAPFGDPQSIFREVMVEPNPSVAVESDAEVPAHFRRQIVNYATHHAPGTVVIDTPNTYLYYVMGGGKAVRYGIGVGREGFTWSGVQSVSKKAEWPDWTPPAEMIARQPYLPRFMAGGPGNPLGARAMYLGGTIYRIHGTNNPGTIGHRVSSGCIRLTNEDVADLYARVNVGTKVVVLPMSHREGPREAPVAQRSVPMSVSFTANRSGSIY